MRSFVVFCVLFAVAAALPAEELKPVAKDQAMEELDSHPRDKRALLLAPSIGLGYAGAYLPAAYSHSSIVQRHHPSVPAVSYISPYSHYNSWNSGVYAPYSPYSHIGLGYGWL